MVGVAFTKCDSIIARRNAVIGGHKNRRLVAPVDKQAGDGRDRTFGATTPSDHS
jgi:hypothetical protein